MKHNLLALFLWLTFIFPLEIVAQDIKIFTTKDFDLNGKVKSCLVSTSYGKEEYEFNVAGLLIKSVTRYNDQDYDITYYKYADNGMLLEKRLENYRNDTFDNTTSIANVYTIDSLLETKITEKIVSYDKEFIDQYEYFYTDDTLRKVIRSNNSGIDETLISYTDIEGEQTKTLALNGFVLESIRNSVNKVNDSTTTRTILTKKFIEGMPNTASEELLNGQGKIETQTKFVYDLAKKQFIKEEVIKYVYDKEGVLLKRQFYKDETLQEEQKFAYQFDIYRNWVKEIILPENLYKTRKITYHEDDKLAVPEK